MTTQTNMNMTTPPLTLEQLPAIFAGYMERAQQTEKWLGAAGSVVKDAYPYSYEMIIRTLTLVISVADKESVSLKPYCDRKHELEEYLLSISICEQYFRFVEQSIDKLVEKMEKCNAKRIYEKEHHDLVEKISICQEQLNMAKDALAASEMRWQKRNNRAF